MAKTYPKKSACMADGGKVKTPAKKPPAPTPPADGKAEAKSFLDGLKALNADVKSGKVGAAPAEKNP